MVCRLFERLLKSEHGTSPLESYLLACHVPHGSVRFGAFCARVVQRSSNDRKKELKHDFYRIELQVSINN